MAGHENPPSDSPAVALFQKAHQRMVMLQRVDEQLASMLAQRRQIQEELRDVQAQINDEFQRVMIKAEEVPQKILSQLNDQAGSARGNGRASRRIDHPTEAAA